MQRIVDVYHVETAATHLTAGIRASEIHKAARRVGHDVVHAMRDSVVRVLAEGLRLGDPMQTIQIEDLHPVVSRSVGHNKGIVLVGLDLAPERSGRARGLRYVA